MLDGRPPIGRVTSAKWSPTLDQADRAVPGWPGATPGTARDHDPAGRWTRRAIDGRSGAQRAVLRPDRRAACAHDVAASRGADPSATPARGPSRRWPASDAGRCSRASARFDKTVARGIGSVGAEPAGSSTAAPVHRRLGISVPTRRLVAPRPRPAVRRRRRRVARRAHGRRGRRHGVRIMRSGACGWPGHARARCSRTCVPASDLAELAVPDSAIVQAAVAAVRVVARHGSTTDGDPRLHDRSAAP